MLEKMLNDLLNDPETEAQVDKTIRRGFGPTPSDEHTHMGKVAAAMAQHFEDQLYALIAERITKTLKAEGELDLRGLRDKCSSVTNLPGDLLLDHLKYAAEKGMISSRTRGETVYYFALPEK